jgi:hypothetical protein
VPDGTPDATLESLVRVPEICEAKVNREAGEFHLIFKPGTNGLFGIEHFHPADIDEAHIRDPELRAHMNEYVGRAWRIMFEEFRAAVRARRCILFAKYGSVFNEFRPVPPDIFGLFEVTNLFMGTATTEAGERLYLVHVAAVDHATAEEKLGDVAAQATRQRKRPRALKLENARAAVEAIRTARGTIDDLSDKELAREVRRVMEEQKQPVPSNETIRRAAGRRRRG